MLLHTRDAEEFILSLCAGYARCNYRKDNTTVFQDSQCLPINVDWFGFDFYAHDSVSWTGPRQAYQEHVYPRLSRVDQRVVPVSLGYSGDNLTAPEAAQLDSFCAENARQFLKFGLEDSRVVGMFPFHWNGGGGTYHITP